MRSRLIVVVPGLHEASLTGQWLQAMRSHGPIPPLQIAPATVVPYAPAAVLEWLRPHLTDPNCPVTAIGFSAGCVGLRAALPQLARAGQAIDCFIALDGWGVPLAHLPFRTYRLSRDRFSHRTASLLGAGDSFFWADPPVEHLDLWRSPATAVGYWQRSGQAPRATTAAHCLYHWAFGEVGDRVPR